MSGDVCLSAIWQTWQVATRPKKNSNGENGSLVCGPLTILSRKAALHVMFTLPNLVSPVACSLDLAISGVCAGPLQEALSKPQIQA